LVSVGKSTDHLRPGVYSTSASAGGRAVPSPRNRREDRALNWTSGHEAWAGSSKDRDYSTFRANRATCRPGFPLLGTRPLHQASHFPRLGLGDRTAFLDHHPVAHLGVVAFVVGVVFLRAAHDLADRRVLHLALDQHGHGLVHAIAHDGARQLAMALHGGLGGLGHFALAFDFSLRRVCTRAIWRRTRFTSLFLARLCVATCIRSPNCARRSSSSSLPRSSALFERSSLVLL